MGQFSVLILIFNFVRRTLSQNKEAPPRGLSFKGTRRGKSLFLFTVRPNASPDLCSPCVSRAEAIAFDTMKFQKHLESEAPGVLLNDECRTALVKYKYGYGDDQRKKAT